MADKEFNPYEILGVTKDASIDDIKKQYKARSKDLHPDQGGDPEAFVELQKAFSILTDPAKRNMYDEYGINDSLDIENEAKLVAIQIVLPALDALPTSCDADKEIAAIFTRCLNGLKEQEQAAKEARDKLQRRLDAIQKKPADDFLTDEIDRVIQGYHRAMKQAQLNHKIHDMAFSLVKGYKFDITKITSAADINSNPQARVRAESLQRQSHRDLYSALGIRS